MLKVRRWRQYVERLLFKPGALMAALTWEFSTWEFSADQRSVGSVGFKFQEPEKALEQHSLRK